MQANRQRAHKSTKIPISKTQMHKRGKHVRIHFKEHGPSMEDLTMQVFDTQVSQSV